jgi:hypothetical protein
VGFCETGCVPASVFVSGLDRANLIELKAQATGLDIQGHPIPEEEAQLLLESSSALIERQRC